MPPPPPAPPTAPQSAVVGSFANATATDEPKADKTAVEQTTRSNLLAEIQSGIKLKQVQRKEQAAEEKAAAEANDVAAILRRRMEHVLGNSDSNTDSQCVAMSRELMLSCLKALKKSVCGSLTGMLAHDSAAYCARRIEDVCFAAYMSQVSLLILAMLSDCFLFGMYRHV
ncbi:hypothetical protein Tcan_11149 [Toxocara canis]|uniref:WH2 domain-containing protein n=1 Tax=Toxocara canis TaxID=6265 RepID=A0A0B2VCA8_TOXCA|nr:hypothetical protein Tcan_11149 [Toxocara canis]